MSSILSGAAPFFPAVLAVFRLFVRWPRLFHALTGFSILMVAQAVRAQVVDQGFVFKNQVYSQTTGTPLTYTGSLLTAGFQFRDPITIISTSNALISGPGFISAPALLDNSGLVVSTATYPIQDRIEFRTAFPPGSFRFQFLIPAIFDGSVSLGLDDFPTPAQISNLSALQNAGASAKVDWTRAGPIPTSDHIVVTVSDATGEELFLARGMNTSGGSDGAATTATVSLPPGVDSTATVTVVRPTAISEVGDATLVAGFASITRFPIRSIAPRDSVAPQVVAQSPELNAVGVSPTASVFLTFDEPMRPRGLLTGVTAPSGKRQRLTWSEDQRMVRVDFPTPLPLGPIELKFTNASTGQTFQDLSGNPVSAGSRAAAFFVGNLPFFSSNPGNAAVVAGSNVTLSAAVVWPPGGLSYQWLKNGVPIPGATNSVLTVPNFGFADCGIYELQATNTNGATMSSPAVVAVDFGRVWPRGGIQPSAEAVYPYEGRAITPGLPLTLSVSMDPGSSGSVSWRKDGRRLTGANQSTLVFPSLAETDTGLYEAVLTNSYGSTATAPFALVVASGAPLPSYTAIRENVTISAGLTLNLGSFAQIPFGFQRGWQFNGQWISQNGTDTSLVVPNIAAKDAGVYRYYVSNGRDTVLVAEYTVAVRALGKAPVITGQPHDMWITESAADSTSPSVEGEPPFTYQWRKNGVDVPELTGSILVVGPPWPDRLGTFTCVIRNAYGLVETNPITVRFWSERTAPEKPSISGPKLRVYAVGETLFLESNNAWSPAHARTYTWRRNGELLPGGYYLQVPGLRPEHSGNYSVIYGNDYGTAESDAVQVRVLGPTDPPYVDGPKILKTTRLADNLELYAPVIVAGNASYRWFLNGREVTAENLSANAHSFTIASVQPSHIGTWTVEVTNAGGTVTAPAAEVALDPGPPAYARLINISTRATAGNGADTLIVGFAINGNGPKPMLLRATGSGLRRFSVGGGAKDARLEVYRGNTRIAANDDWFRQPKIAELLSAQYQAGAFPLDTADPDAALVTTLEPGAYTMLFTTPDPASGPVGLLEAYDLDPGNSPVRVTNLSARLFVGSGEQTAICGVVVGGTGTRSYLVRAIGPGLQRFNVSGVLADPKIELVGSGGFRLTNDDWGTSSMRAALIDAAEKVAAFALESGSKDAALIVTLKPGNYSALVSGAQGESGIALIEFYELPDS